MYFIRDIPEEKWIPKKREAPIVAKFAPNLHPIVERSLQQKLAAASLPIPFADGEHVQLFKTMWDRKRKFYTGFVEQHVLVQQQGQAEN